MCLYLHTPSNRNLSHHKYIMRFLSLALVAVIVIGCGESEADRIAREQADSTRRADSVAALLAPRKVPYEKAVSLVKERLKSPSTARFADVSMEDDTVTIRFKGDSLAYVYGEYDAQNAFGTFMHGYYKVSLQKRNGEWTGKDEQFDFNNVELTDYKPIDLSIGG